MSSARTKVIARTVPKFRISTGVQNAATGEDDVGVRPLPLPRGRWKRVNRRLTTFRNDQMVAGVCALSPTPKMVARVEVRGT